MRSLCKASLALVLLMVAFATAPAVKADAISVTSGGFSLTGLGNDGKGVTDKDSLFGNVTLQTHQVNPGDDFVALLNPLTFTTGFTGDSSGGTHQFTFTQLLTINGQTQTLNVVGSIDISHFVDTLHIDSAAPLTFNFNTFSVLVTLLPTDIVGFGEGSFTQQLAAQFNVVPIGVNPKADAPVPEPATLTLLGLGLAGVAAKVRHRRKSKIT